MVGITRSKVIFTVQAVNIEASTGVCATTDYVGTGTVPVRLTKRAKSAGRAAPTPTRR